MEKISEHNGIQKAYEIVGATNPAELSRLYTAEDQRLMKSSEWDYENPDLLTNKIKDILEPLDPRNLNDFENDIRGEILWFWYHHAISSAIWRQKDKEKAKEFAKKALEFQSEDHPNKITNLLYLLVHDQLAKAKDWAGAITKEPEKTTSNELIEEYIKGEFF